MKIKINTKIIAALNPCSSRFENWFAHYENFEGDLVEFLDLENITASDKVWVAVRVLPLHLVEVFAIECAVYAATATATASATDATAAAYATDGERQRQIEALIWLVQNA